MKDSLNATGCAGGTSSSSSSSSQIVLVAGTQIASAKLQSWESSGLRSIFPLNASDAKRLGATWIWAAGAALAAHGVEVGLVRQLVMHFTELIGIA